MKNNLLALAAALSIVVSAPVLAQGSSGSGALNDDVEQLLSQIQADKRTIVLTAMELTDAEAARFTPIYDEYQAERKELMQRMVATINKFAANYESMTDGAAKDILKEWFEIREDDVDLVEKYAKRLGRELPAPKVLRFVQVENKLQNVLQLEATSIVPLAK